MQRRNGMIYYYNPVWATHYEKIHPYRKLLLIGGIILSIVGVCLFISVPVTAASLHGFSPFLPIGGFLGVFLIFLGCVGCQCGYASKINHEYRENNPNGGIAPYSYTVHGYGPAPPMPGQGYPSGFVPTAGHNYAANPNYPQSGPTIGFTNNTWAPYPQHPAQNTEVPHFSTSKPRPSNENEQPPPYSVANNT